MGGQPWRGTKCRCGGLRQLEKAPIRMWEEVQKLKTPDWGIFTHLLNILADDREQSAMDMQMSWLRPGEVFKMSSFGRDSDYSSQSFLPGHVQPLGLAFRPWTDPIPHRSVHPPKKLRDFQLILPDYCCLRVFPASRALRPFWFLLPAL